MLAMDREVETDEGRDLQHHDVSATDRGGWRARPGVVGYQSNESNESMSAISIEKTS